jgi:spore coat protein SA
VVEKPARELGIRDKLTLAGYCSGDRLVAAFRAMDVLLYPIPGSDQSCRTVREAMAAGVPVVAPRIGFLPELVEDRVTGYLMNSASVELVLVLRELIQNRPELKQMGRRALERAVRRFPPALQAEKVLSFYQRLLR